MIQFVIDDSVKECHQKRSKLDQYYKKLLAAYLRSQLEENMMNDNDPSKPIWTIDINSEENDDSEDKTNVVQNINNDDTDQDIFNDPVLADKILKEEKLLIPKSKSNQKKTYQQSDMNTSNSDINMVDKTSKSTKDNNRSNDDQSTSNVRKEHDRTDL
ncbi:unnamed protein product [Rotaria sp. Silwood2]|nr:unnamed protein product [Rotaria sp. Silwood2]CAF4043631.1 unnamed protein product [Rotaria sp. Silwood2]